MTGKEGQTAQSSSQDNYEATVLDFLDREMSAVQPSQKPKEYSEELDELVSDLLKQVINEADQKKPIQNAGVETIDDLLAELGPIQEGSPSGAKKDSPSSSGLNLNKAASQPADVEPAAIEKPAKTDSHKPSGSLFASPAANKRKTPVMAIAFVGLLAIVGGAIYFFSNSTSSESKKAATQPAAAESPAPSVASNTLQAQNRPPAPQAQAPAAPTSSTSQPVAADSSKRTASPAKNTKASDTRTEQASVASAKNTKGSEANTQQPAAGSANLTAAPPKMETPAPPVAAPPAVSNNNAPSERQVAPVASESTKEPEAAAEKKPAPIVPSAPKPAPSTPVSTASSTPEPPANIAAAAKNPSPAVPISRANPQYPELALRTRASATVVLDVSIDSQGKVTKATPISGPVIFHNEAIKAAMKWRYKPASIEGTNVPSQNKITFNFNLKQ